MSCSALDDELGVVSLKSIVDRRSSAPIIITSSPISHHAVGG
jgi:hypothetical protein